ncbi:hypothetical protein AGMMS49975_30100 [Clostridia bacterium]|nr:hypothetical protein AGMMS49975_30100 [Clostridia bacterium]
MLFEMLFAVPVFAAVPDTGVIAVLCVIFLVHLAVLFTFNGFELNINENYRLDVVDGVVYYKFTAEYEGNIPLDVFESITITKTDENTALIVVKASGVNVFMREIPEIAYKYAVKPKLADLKGVMGDKIKDEMN